MSHSTKMIECQTFGNRVNEKLISKAVRQHKMPAMIAEGSVTEFLPIAQPQPTIVSFLNLGPKPCGGIGILKLKKLRGVSISEPPLVMLSAPIPSLLGLFTTRDSARIPWGTPSIDGWIATPTPPPHEMLGTPTTPLYGLIAARNSTLRSHREDSFLGAVPPGGHTSRRFVSPGIL